MHTRSWRIAAALLAVCSLAGVRPAHAYRPFDFSDADVAEEHTLEIELAPVEFARRGPDHELRVPALTLNFGLGGGYELGVEGVRNVPIEGEGDEALGPTVFESGASITKLVRGGRLQEKQGPSIAVEGIALFPTREGPHMGFETNGVISTAGKTGAVHFGVAASRLPTGEDEAGAGLILETHPFHGWRPVVELKAIGTRGEATDKGLLTGVIFQPSDGLAFDFAVNYGESGGERWTELRGGATYQIGRRGFKNIKNYVKYHLRRER